MTKPITPRERIDIHAVLRSASSAGSRFHDRRFIFGLGIAALVVAMLLYWLAARPSATVAYVTEPVTKSKLTVIVTATGSVQPTKKVDVSSELSGTVRQVYVDYNSMVTAGQLLAELDTDKLVAAVDSSRAKLATAEARLAEAQATIVEKDQELKRKRPLASKQISSIHDLEAAQAAYDRAVAALASTRAEIRAAEAQLKLDQTNLAKSRIVSPIGGTVLKRSVEPGQTVASTLQAPTLFSIAEDLKQMEVQVDVDEADVGKVSVGQKGSFSVDAYPGRRFPAEVKLVRFASETVQGVVTYKGILAVDNSELLLRPGMTATAEIIVTEISDAVLIPNAALRYTPATPDRAASRTFLQRILPGPPFRTPVRRDTAGAGRSVWVLRNGQPVSIRVAIGPSDGKLTVVTSGDLKPGDSAIVDESTVQ